MLEINKTMFIKLAAAVEKCSDDRLEKWCALDLF